MKGDGSLRYRFIAMRIAPIQQDSLTDRRRSVRMTVRPEDLRSTRFQLTAQLCVQVLARSEASDQEKGLRTRICEPSWIDLIKVITDIT